MTLDNKFKTWIKNKALQEFKKPMKRLDESFTWRSLYQSFYHESFVTINKEKIENYLFKR